MIRVRWRKEDVEKRSGRVIKVQDTCVEGLRTPQKSPIKITSLLTNTVTQDILKRVALLTT